MSSGGQRRAWHRVKAVLVPVLVLVGGVLLPVVGWLVGVTLVWVSPEYSKRQRLLALLAPPGGLASTVAVYSAAQVAQTCRGSAPLGHHIVLACTSNGPALPVPLVALLFFGSVTLAIYTFSQLWRPANTGFFPPLMAGRAV